MATGRVPTTANSPLTAKGDLFTYDTSQARLAVGNNGETLVADSSATTGLRWQGNYAAGKNFIINGDFRINQRAFTSITATGYGFDRWRFGVAGDGTATHSTQAFTLGAAPVAGYEAANFARIVTTGQTQTGTQTALQQRIESVRNLAGQTATISFWAKAASGTPKIAIELVQNFGSGGSPSTQVNNYVGQVTLSTTWTRYSATYAVPSISGKTIGTDANTDFLQLALWVSAGSDLNSRTGSLGIQTGTFDIWGVQLEAGNTATAFQTATGTLAGELAACQRYYERIVARGGATVNYSGVGHYYNTTDCYVVQNYVTKRTTTPTMTFSSNTDFTANSAGANRASTLVAADIVAANAADYYIRTASVTAGASAVAGISNAAGWIAIEAEL